MEYYSAIKRKTTMAFVTTWIDLRAFWNKSDKDKYYMVWSHFCVDSKKTKFTETESRWVAAMSWELVETGRCSKV